MASDIQTLRTQYMAIEAEIVALTRCPVAKVRDLARTMMGRQGLAESPASWVAVGTVMLAAARDDAAVSARIAQRPLPRVSRRHDRELAEDMGHYA